MELTDNFHKRLVDTLTNGDLSKQKEVIEKLSIGVVTSIQFLLIYRDWIPEPKDIFANSNN